MAKKDNKCPFCGKFTLELYEEVKHGWLKCSNCGATHLPNPTKLKHVSLLEQTYMADEVRHYAATPIKKKLRKPVTA